eukprot:COSAG05_NODE_1173_length_5620_cov_18.750589_2_plen_71_part_00
MVKFAIDFVDGQAVSNEKEEEREDEEDEQGEKSKDTFENRKIYETKRSTKWRALRADAWRRQNRHFASLA